jgi:DNA-directed RNA polymerase subunit K
MSNNIVIIKMKNKMVVKKGDFTQYELARVLGARSLQIAMDAPLLTDISEKELEEINYSPMKIAQIELENEALPITVKQPMPKKRAVKIKKTKEEEKSKDDELLEKELDEEKEIAEEGEIMELANPGDEEEPGEDEDKEEQ